MKPSSSKSAIISQYQNGGLLYTKCSGPYGKHQFWYQMHKPHWSPLAERLPKKGDALNTYYHVAVTADKKLTHYLCIEMEDSYLEKNMKILKD